MQKNAAISKNLREEATLHFLPLTLAKSGQAEIDKYFKPVDNQIILHGRQLSGVDYQQGDKQLFIMEQKNGQNTLIQKVKNVQYWLYETDKQPMEQFLHFTELLDVLHNEDTEIMENSDNLSTQKSK